MSISYIAERQAKVETGDGGGLLLVAVLDPECD